MKTITLQNATFTLSDDEAAVCGEVYERATSPKGELFEKGQKSATEQGA